MKTYNFKTFITDEYITNYSYFLQSYKSKHEDRKDTFAVCFYELSNNSKINLRRLAKEVGIANFSFEKIENTFIDKNNDIERLKNAFGKLDVILSSNTDFILHDCDLYFFNSFYFELLDNNNICVATDPEETFNSGFIKFCNDLSQIKSNIKRFRFIRTKYTDQDVLTRSINNYSLINNLQINCRPLYAMTQQIANKISILHYIGEDKNIKRSLNKINR